MRKIDVLKLWFSKFNKFVFWSVFGDLQLTQISLSFQTAFCNSNFMTIQLKLRLTWLTYLIKLKYTFLFISNTLTSNGRLKLAKSQANAKQHPEAELLLHYSHFSSTLSSKKAVIKNMYSSLAMASRECSQKYQFLM